MGRVHGILTLATLLAMVAAAVLAPIEMKVPRPVMRAVMEPGVRFIAYLVPFFIAHIGVYPLATSVLLVVLVLDCNVAIAARVGGRKAGMEPNN